MKSLARLGDSELVQSLSWLPSTVMEVTLGHGTDKPWEMGILAGSH